MALGTDVLVTLGTPQVPFVLIMSGRTVSECSNGSWRSDHQITSPELSFIMAPREPDGDEFLVTAVVVTVGSASNQKNDHPFEIPVFINSFVDVLFFEYSRCRITGVIK
jgi:hypothetical protein